MADRFAQVNIREGNKGWEGKKKRGEEEVEFRNTPVKRWKVNLNSAQQLLMNYRYISDCVHKPEGNFNGA